MQLKAYLLIIFILLNGYCPAQIKRVGTPYINNYNKNTYNAGTQNWDISQDSNDFLYFANNDGVLRFDGFHWDLLKLPGSSPVRSILVDSRDNIYIGFLNDFGLLSVDRSGKAGFKSLRQLLPEPVADFDEVWKIYETEDGIVFQCYDFLFIYNDSTVKAVKPDNRLHFSFFTGNRIILHEPGVGLSLLEEDDIRRLEWSTALKDYDIEAVFDNGTDGIIIGTARDGIYIYSDNALRPWKSQISRLLQENVLYCAVELTGGFIAWGTILDGLFISDSNGRVVQHINRKSGLQNNTVLDLFTDRENNLWVGLDNGVDYLEISSPISFISDLDILGSGYSCMVTNGYIYFGTNRGLFVKPWKEIDNNNEEFILVEGTEGQVWSLQVFDGQLICGHNLGTFRVEGVNAVKICDVEGAWKYLRLRNQPDYLIGGHYSGLVLLKKKSGKWEFFKNISGFRESCRFLEENSDGTVWISHGGKGIFKITLSHELDTVTNFRQYNTVDGLPSGEKNKVIIFNGQPCFSTIKGIYNYDEERDIFIPCEKVNEILDINDRLMALTTDRRGNIWYITETSSGVLRINEDLTFTKIESPFSRLEDMFISEFEFIYPLDDQNVFFGIDNGFAHYSSEFKKPYYDDFMAIITSIEVPFLDSVIYYANSEDKHPYEFPFSKNSFRFNYTSPFYENLDQLLFSYQLDNFEGTWSGWTRDIYKDFTNLREGDYTFAVKALNAYGIESMVSEFSFSILPPWYRSRFAYYGYALMILIIVYLILRLIRSRVEKTRIRVIDRHNRELKEREEKFMHESLVAEKELIRIRNEKLKNEMIHRNKELANQTMGIIQKNKFLMKLKSELRELHSVTSDARAKSKISVLGDKIDREINIKLQNRVFQTYFEGVHSEFFKRLKEKHPELSPKEMYLCAYLLMNLSTKEIAALQNISERGVEIGRYRLRKKLQLSRDTNLSTYLSKL